MHKLININCHFTQLIIESNHYIIPLLIQVSLILEILAKRLYSIRAHN